MKRPMISYAQNFEDVMLYRVFRDQPTGFYVDVGAADPVQHSVTKWFYDLGWSGINIEPRAVFFEALQRERPGDVNLNCGAGAVSGEAPFFEMSVTPEWSSFDDVARTEAVARGEPIVERTLPILTLNDIIERYGEGRTIDFLKIDVEGWEGEVLRGLDLLRHPPTVIVVEATHQGTTEPSYAAWEDILTNADYRRVYFDGLNNFYVGRERADLAKHFTVSPNVFDEYKLYDEKLEQIHALAAMVGQSQAEGEARLQQIHALTAMMGQSQAESKARLQQIDTLAAKLQQQTEEVERLTARNEALLATVGDLQPRASRYDRLIATLRMPDAPKPLKIVLPLARLIRKTRTLLWLGA